jgi:AcrR family transcriptional regulator
MSTSAEREDGRTRRAEAQRESRRAHILDTAREVFADKGYHQTRVSDILEAASIARGTFYLYFESKAAIFLELLDELLAELQQSMVGVDLGPEAPPVQDQLLATVTRIMTTVQEHEVLTPIIFREAVGLDAVVDSKLRDFYRHLHMWIRDSLRAGQTMGVVRELDSDIVASCILGSIKYLLEQDVLEGGTVGRDPERVGREVLAYNLHGVLYSQK